MTVGIRARTATLDMSNFDHEVPPGMAEELRARPNEAVSRHFAWEFCGAVWFDGESFVEDVFRYHQKVETVVAPDLETLMRMVNDRWGWE